MPAQYAVVDARPARKTRAEAFEAFLQAVRDAVPEEGDWAARRRIVRDAGTAYASAAVWEAISPTVVPGSKRDDIALDTQIYGSVGDEE